MAVSHRVILAKGWTSTIYISGDIEPDKIVKVIDRAVHKEATKEDLEKLFEAEKKAYERLNDRQPGSVPILDYYGIDAASDFGLILGRVDNGDLFRYLYQIHIDQPKDEELLLKWAKQAATGLAYCHKNNVLHVDIHTANCFLDQNLDLKIGDFGAASVDGSRPALMYRTSHQLWIDDGHGGLKKAMSVASEIFALGCVMYEIEARTDAFEDLDDQAIKERLQRREMPELEDLTVLSTIISKCWSLQYTSMDDTVRDLESLAQRPAAVSGQHEASKST